MSLVTEDSLNIGENVVDAFLLYIDVLNDVSLFAYYASLLVC